MSFILLVVLQFFFLHATTATFHSSLCAPGRLEVAGVEIVERNRGRILLAVKTGLQCPDCHKHLREFSLMAESISDLSVAILVPSDESQPAVRHSQLEFPKLQIVHDQAGTTSHWESNMQLLFDRCGRVSKIIHVRPEAPPFHDALEAVRAAVSHAQCGWCQYDTRGARDLSKKQFDAYIRNDRRNSHERSQRTDYGQQRVQDQDYRRQEQWQRQYGQDQRERTYSHSQSQPQNYQQSQHIQRNSHQYQQAYQSPQQTQYNQGQQNQYPQQRDRQAERQFQGTYPNYGFQQPQNVQDNRQFQSTNQGSQHDTRTWASTTSTTPKPMKKLHYSEDSDYGDYLDEGVPTTVRTEVQIPRPHGQQSMVWWPTPPTTTIDYRLMMGADVPCAAFTDDICYMQQEKLGRDQLPKCCSKGLYLTDLCVPGKCSNTTTQLCCLQKFLQAKFSCCQDESQSDGSGTTNQFSQCCYSRFVAKDECCTQEKADDYWSSVHELCYPNTKFDLSTVKLEVRFAEGMRVIDLGENRIWEHECKHGGNRMQLAYFP